jgi:hypothetical protein
MTTGSFEGAFGVATETANTDSTSTTASLMANIKGLLANSAKLLFDSNGWLQVTLATAISSATDSIDVAKMSAGGLVTAHSAITATATSSEVDCRGFNSVRIEREITATSASGWIATITGSEVSGGTFGAISKDVGITQTAVPALASITAIGKTTYILTGCNTNFIKITETLGGGTGTITTKVVPFNV